LAGLERIIGGEGNVECRTIEQGMMKGLRSEKLFIDGTYLRTIEENQGGKVD
jgi:hypothetical protein